MATVDLSFGERLRRLCEHAGISLGEMASVCGVGASGFAGYVSNRIKMPAEKYALVADRLDLTMDGLYYALGLRSSDRGEHDFALWWSETLMRRHSLEASGLLQRPPASDASSVSGRQSWRVRGQERRATAPQQGDDESSAVRYRGWRLPEALAHSARTLAPA